MITTRNNYVEFGIKAHAQESRVSCNTNGSTIKKTETIRIFHKNDRGEICSGFRKVNFSEQKRRQTYQKINEMLGGN